MFGKRGTQQQVVTPVQPRPADPPPPEPQDPPEQPPPLADFDSNPPEAAPPEPQPEAEIAPPEPAAKTPKPKKAADSPAPPAPPVGMVRTQAASDKLAEIKVVIFNDLLEAVDLAEISKLSTDQVREEISDMTAEIISMRGLVLTIQEQQQVIVDICNDILGLGPLEPLLERDDIADIMVNGAGKVFIETDGKIELTDITFRDNAQLMNPALPR